MFHNLTPTGPCILNMYLFKYSGILSILAIIAYFLNFCSYYFIYEMFHNFNCSNLYKYNIGLFKSSWVVPKKYNFIRFINTDILKLFLTF